MLKKSLILLFALFLFGSQAYSESVDEIIAQNIKARGGKAKYENMETYQMKMRMNMMGMNMPMTIYMKDPDKMRMDVTMMGQNVITVLNGDRAWVSQGGQVTELPQDQVSKVKEQMDQQSNFLENQFIDYKDKGIKIVLEGTEEVDDKNCFVLKVTDKEGETSTLYIDTETYLEHKIITTQQNMGQEMEMEIFIKNNKWVNGILVPHKMEMYSDGEPAGEFIIEDVIINEPIDNSLFTME